MQKISNEVANALFQRRINNYKEKEARERIEALELFHALSEEINETTDVLLRLDLIQTRIDLVEDMFLNKRRFVT